jgi:hypothetical protein
VRCWGFKVLGNPDPPPDLVLGQKAKQEAFACGEGVGVLLLAVSDACALEMRHALPTLANLL